MTTGGNSQVLVPPPLISPRSAPGAYNPATSRRSARSSPPLRTAVRPSLEQTPQSAGQKGLSNVTKSPWPLKLRVASRGRPAPDPEVRSSSPALGAELA